MIINTPLLGALILAVQLVSASADDSVEIVGRALWQAQPASEPPSPFPAIPQYVIISHTVSEPCLSEDECMKRLQQIQNMHMEGNKWSDIAYNFLVGGDGRIYEGRGWDSVGAHTLKWNMKSIGLSFIGTFNEAPPSQQQLTAAQKLMELGVKIEPGFNILVPIIDKIKYVQSLKEIAIDVPKQSAITSDNVTLDIDGVLYLRINDPYLTSYGVEDPEFAIIQLAQTTMRSELGKISLDNVFREREGLNVNIVASINKASEVWGITCLRYEIRDIRLPAKVQEAMQMQVEAERKKRAAILESEGIRTADINVAEGKRQSRILASEAEKQEQINKAIGEASALLAVAEARGKSLQMVASALRIEDGKNAASLVIAEQYVNAFDKLARTNNTLILPSNVGDVSSFVAQAMTIYKQLLPPTPSDDRTSQYRQKNLPNSSEADEVYEYFSDQEDAEAHRNSNKPQKA